MNKKIMFFSAKPYDKEFFIKCNENYGFELDFYETHLGPHILDVVHDTYAICAFVNDKLNREVLTVLAERGVKVVAMRCAGYNNVDIEAAQELGIRVCRVPAYSPQAVAEHALAMILTLNRKTHKAYNRVREQNFSLNGLLGFDISGKTLGIVGTGNIGRAFCKIMQGFDCKVIAYDVFENEEMKKMGATYMPLMDVLSQADIISLHCPLNDDTYHMINSTTIKLMKPGVTLINTSRGGLIDTKSVVKGLKNKQIGALGLDVYEQEEKLFFRDLSANIIEDDIIQRLMGFPNVLVTAHQAFFTREALEQISQTTLKSVNEFSDGKELSNPAALVV